MEVNIGEIIHDLIQKKGLKAKAVADFVHISESSLYKIYKRKSIDIDKLIKFSELLDTNLFLHYLDKEPLKSMFGKQLEVMQRRVHELENKLNAKNERVNDLLQVIESQKKIIALQEANELGDKDKSSKREKRK